MDFSFDNFVVDDQNEAAYKAVKDFINNIEMTADKARYLNRYVLEN